MAAVTKEADTSRIQLWLGQHLTADLLISEWCNTEFAAALSRKRGAGTISGDDIIEARAYFQLMVDVSIRVIPVSTDHFHDAAQKAEHSSTGLRAGDALHLAICASEGATLCTLDKRLAAAGPELGVATLLL